MSTTTIRTDGSAEHQFWWVNSKPAANTAIKKGINSKPAIKTTSPWWVKSPSAEPGQKFETIQTVAVHQRRSSMSEATYRDQPADFDTLRYSIGGSLNSYKNLSELTNGKGVGNHL